MITFEVLTIFPELIAAFKNESLLKKGCDKKLLKINAHNLRGYSIDKHQSVDDSPYGGGFGMVLKGDVILRALKKIAGLKFAGKKLKAGKGTKIILLTPRGKAFNQAMAVKLAKEKKLVFICGRYEGVDERVAKHMADMELSIGDYDLMGGEVAAMAVIETVSRLIKGVIGRAGFLAERNTKEGFFESAQYTRPEIISPKNGVAWRVPKELLCGDPKIVGSWRKKHGKTII
jgi:tRNA (guanine37-N1)-methyltransferase